MRNFVQNEVRLRSATRGFSWFRVIFRNVRQKRELLRLEGLSASQLRDVGLTGDDLSYLGRLPLGSDLDWEAERLRLIASRRISSTGNR
jgi:uncharacterized protein YjiS (DUF1127 family)